MTHLDREAARRVLRRAVELDGADQQLPAPDAIDPEALVAAAAEVGIAERVVRRGRTG